MKLISLTFFDCAQKTSSAAKRCLSSILWERTLVVEISWNLRHAQFFWSNLVQNDLNRSPSFRVEVCSVSSNESIYPAMAGRLICRTIKTEWSEMPEEVFDVLLQPYTTQRLPGIIICKNFASNIAISSILKLKHYSVCIRKLATWRTVLRNWRHFRSKLVTMPPQNRNMLD